MYKLSLFSFLIVFSVLQLSAQDNLRADSDFFQKKAQVYQRWLDAKGIGEVLKLDKMRLQRNDTELELFLNIPTLDPDSAAALWQALEASFVAENADQEMGEVLFRTFVRMMEIPPGQGNMQIYIPDKSGFGYNACFYIWLWEEDGSIKEESQINNCKAQPIAIEVKPPQVKLVAGGARTRISGRENARAVFDKVLSYARRKYKKEKCYDRYPRVNQEKQSDYQLVFSVSDLCQVVLTDEKPSFVCRIAKDWFNKDCNDMRRERLEFTINYIATEEGYLLNGQLTGKFGSGVYRPRKSAYMDMEPDFEDYLIEHIGQFQNELRSYLEKW